MPLVELLIDIETAQQANRNHRDMPRVIRKASHESEALAQVRQAQYDDAVFRLQDALENVLRLQTQNTELCMDAVLEEKLADELNLLGL